LIKLGYVILSCFVWLAIATLLVRTPTMWTVVSGKLAREESQQLQAGLFAAVTDGPQKWVAVGDRLFVSAVEDVAPQDSVQSLTVPRPNLCEIGEAIGAYAQSFPQAQFIVQASPYFWSNFDLGVTESGPRQSLNYWATYTAEEFGTGNIMRTFFNGMAVLAQPTKVAKAGFDARPSSMRFLAFRTDGKQQKCFARYLKKARVKPRQLLFAVDVRQLDLASNPGLVSAFTACVDTGTCYKGAAFTQLERLSDELKW
jgi:hypothetical protein